MDAYSRTPNTNVPLNNRPKGTVGSIAVEQLRSYQERAAKWRVYRVRRDGRDMYVCQACEESLWFVSDAEEQVYQYTPEVLLALKVAHIRQAHDKDGTNNGQRQD